MEQFDVLVVGGGAAGLLAAGTAAMCGAKTLIIEKNEKLGKKLYITGKGRCNVTNAAPLSDFIANTPTNGRFLYSAFSTFSNTDLIDLLARCGVKTKTERGGRIFPASDKSSDIIAALSRYALEGGAKQIRGKVKTLLLGDEAASAVHGGTTERAVDSGAVNGESAENGDAANGSEAQIDGRQKTCSIQKRIGGVFLEDGRRIYARRVILATGGASYPQTGSTGDGYRLAQEAGHRIIPPLPSLVPLVTQERWVSELMGLSLRNAAIRVTNEKGKEIYCDFGEMLFTHYGVSGPMILSASAHMRDFRRPYRLEIDCKPALDDSALDKRILRDFTAAANKDFANSLDALLPKKMIPVIIRLSEIPPHKKIHDVTREERARLVHLLKALPLTITGTRPIAEAIVTAGGVDTKEINPKTMESKLVLGLYFAGELIDVDAVTGGFNLQIAFSTGYLAGESAAQGALTE